MATQSNVTHADECLSALAFSFTFLGGKSSWNVLVTEIMTQTLRPHLHLVLKYILGIRIASGHTKYKCKQPWKRIVIQSLKPLPKVLWAFDHMSGVFVV